LKGYQNFVLIAVYFLLSLLVPKFDNSDEVNFNKLFDCAYLITFIFPKIIKMEIENPVINSHHLKTSSLAVLNQSFDIIIAEIMTRLSPNSIITQEDRLEVISSIINNKAKLLLIESELLPKQFDVKKFTPMRSNQIEIALLQRDISHFSPDKQKIAEKFVKKFWHACLCRDSCPQKVSLKSTWDIYDRLSNIEDFNERATIIGGALLNFKTTPMDVRSSGLNITYDYRIGSSQICQTFFRFAYQVTEKELKTLQKCIKNNTNFERKNRGNNHLKAEK